MTDRVQLGWRIAVNSWDRFTDAVVEKHADQSLYYRVAIERAMTEFLDEDGILAEAERLLREHTDVREISSSTAAIGTDRYQGSETRLVNIRVRADLKERFQKWADEHNLPYGRLLAAALDAYADGGRARRILEDVKKVVGDATITGSTDESIENSTATDSSSGSTDTDIETSLSTASTSATSSGSTPDPVKVSDAVDALCEIEVTEIDELGTFPRYSLQEAIEQATGSGDQETFELYEEAVLNQVNAEQHPHKDVLYITQEKREEQNLWADLNKEERIILLRRWIVADAVERGERCRSYTYKDVMGICDLNAAAAPSHQYAYDLMEAAADEDGFTYGDFSIGTSASQRQLRVDVSEVSEAVLDWVRDETAADADKIGVIADVTSYSAGAAQQQEGAADD